VEPSPPSSKKRARRSTTISGKRALSQQAGHESNVEGEQAGTWDAKPTNIEKRTNRHRKKNSPPKSNIKNLVDIQAQHRKDHTGNWSKAFSLRAKNLSNLVHNIPLVGWEYAHKQTIRTRVLGSTNFSIQQCKNIIYRRWMRLREEFRNPAVR
jgi:hypothetical protein